MMTAGMMLAEALGRLADEAGRSVRLSTHGTLEVKVYAPRRNRPRATNSMSWRGAREFGSDDARRPFTSGEFLSAPAGLAHRFENFTDDFAVRVFFYGLAGGEVPAAQPSAAGS